MPHNAKQSTTYRFVDDDTQNIPPSYSHGPRFSAQPSRSSPAVPAPAVSTSMDTPKTSAWAMDVLSKTPTINHPVVNSTPLVPLVPKRTSVQYAQSTPSRSLFRYPETIEKSPLHPAPNKKSRHKPQNTTSVATKPLLHPMRDDDKPTTTQPVSAKQIIKDQQYAEVPAKEEMVILMPEFRKEDMIQYEREQTEEHKELPIHNAVFEFVDIVPEKKETVMTISRPTVETVPMNENQQPSTQESKEENVTFFTMPEADSKTIPNKLTVKNQQQTVMTNPTPDIFYSRTQFSSSTKCTVTVSPAGDSAQIAQAQKTAISTQIRANSKPQGLATPPKKALITTASTATTPESDKDYDVDRIQEPWSLEGTTQEKRRAIYDPSVLSKWDTALNNVVLSDYEKKQEDKGGEVQRVRKGCKVGINNLRNTTQSMLYEAKQKAINNLRNIWCKPIGNAASKLDSCDDLEQYKREQTTVTVVRPQASVKIIANNGQRKEQHIATTTPEACAEPHDSSDAQSSPSEQETTISRQTQRNPQNYVTPNKPKQRIIDDSTVDTTPKKEESNHKYGCVSAFDDAVDNATLNPSISLNNQNSTRALGTVLEDRIAPAHAVNQKPYTRDQSLAQHMFLFRASHAPTLSCKQSDQALNQQLFCLHAPDLLIKAQHQKLKQQEKELEWKVAHTQNQALQQDAFDQKRQEQNPRQTPSTPIDTVDFGKKAHDNVCTVTRLKNTLSRIFYKSEH